MYSSGCGNQHKSDLILNKPNQTKQYLCIHPVFIYISKISQVCSTPVTFSPYSFAATVGKFFPMLHKRKCILNVIIIRGSQAKFDTYLLQTI